MARNSNDPTVSTQPSNAVSRVCRDDNSRRKVQNVPADSCAKLTVGNLTLRGK
jgi:hypothetical protein